MPERIDVATNGHVLTVTLARPELHNAFDEVMIQELTAAFRDARESAGVRVVVLAAQGTSFSAGADVHWMRRMVDYAFEENVRDASAMADMLEAIRDCPKPTIARVHGAAFGGGVGLVAACDMAVAIESASFCLSEVKLGIAPAVISPFVMDKIGLGCMRRYALTAERFDANEARRVGLVCEVVSTVEGLDRWMERMGGYVLACGPDAVAACKSILRQVADGEGGHAHELTTKAIAALRVSEEGQEGLKAFLEKRKPSWDVRR
ncbi:MAG: enoyl-CoA hydratase/isomerase family protein [Phycisphaerae bacterium]